MGAPFRGDGDPSDGGDDRRARSGPGAAPAKKARRPPDAVPVMTLGTCARTRAPMACYISQRPQEPQRTDGAGTGAHTTREPGISGDRETAPATRAGEPYPLGATFD